MFNIVVDMSFFVPFINRMDLLEEMIHMLAKVKPIPVVSPLEALGQFDKTKGVMTMDAFLDSFPNDMKTDNYDRFNWLDAINEKIYWVTPFMEAKDYALGTFLTRTAGAIKEETWRTVKRENNVFPSMNVLERSKVFIEMNMYFLKRFPNGLKTLLQKEELINPLWFKFNGEPTDYSSVYETLKLSRDHFNINYREVFLS